MTRAHRKDGAIRVVQQKTGAELWVPERHDLTAELALGGGHMSLLTRADSSAFDSANLGVAFAESIERAGLPDACVNATETERASSKRPPPRRGKQELGR